VKYIVGAIEILKMGIMVTEQVGTHSPEVLALFVFYKDKLDSSFRDK
jgi:hypothetical protein